MEDAVRGQHVKSLVHLMKGCLPVDESNQKSLHNLQQQLQTLRLLLSACLTEVGREIAQTEKDEALKVGSGSEAYIVIPDAQWIEPRGRFTASISGEGILLEGKAVNCFIRWHNISHIACVPSNASMKKEGEELMAFLLLEPVKCNNKDMKMFLWNLSKSVVKEISATNPSSSSPISGSEHVVISSLVSTIRKLTIVTPNKDLFQSATKQRPYLKCYKGIQEGALYPLKNGLIFMKPLLFIPTEDIASITAGRGGSGSTRYIDLLIDTVDGKAYEFSNIEREELLAIQIYVNEHLEARKRSNIKAEKGLKIEGGIKSEDSVKDESHECQDGNAEEDDDDDESDDEDFDPDASDEDASGRDSDDSGNSDEYSSPSDNEDELERSQKQQSKDIQRSNPKKSSKSAPEPYSNSCNNEKGDEDKILLSSTHLNEGNCSPIYGEKIKSIIQEEIASEEESVHKKARLSCCEENRIQKAYVKEENVWHNSE